MAKPPSLKNINANDYKDIPDWFKQLLDQKMNQFFNTVSNALAGNLSSENFSTKTYSFTLNLNSPVITISDPALPKEIRDISVKVLPASQVNFVYSTPWETAFNGLKVYFVGFPASSDTKYTVEITVYA